MSNQSIKKNKVLLIILDGYGARPGKDGNTVHLADTPYLDSLFWNNPQGVLCASGEDVGLPTGLMGNSEVGHLSLGAGRIVFQELSRINRSISNGEFYDNPAILDSVINAINTERPLHLLGLVSDGCVHSSLEHIYALLEICAEHGLKEVYLHAFMDGRDTAPHSGSGFIKQIEDKMQELRTGKIASVSGRYWAMDRDKRWERVERAYKLLTDGAGLKFKSAIEAIETSYEREITDEFIEPSVICEDEKPLAVIEESDSVIFFNFRADRGREISGLMANSSSLGPWNAETANPTSRGRK